MTDREFKRRIDAIFARHRRELEAKRLRLDQRQKAGWVYKRIYREEVRIKRHTRAGHYALIPVRAR